MEKDDAGRSQVDRLWALLKDMKPHRTDEIVRLVYGPGHPLSRVGARIYDLRRRLPADMDVKSWPDQADRTLWWYQATAKPTAEPGQLGLFGEPGAAGSPPANLLMGR